MAITDLLLGAVLLGLLFVIGLLFQVRRTVAESDAGVETDQLTAALSQSLSSMEFGETVSRIEDRAGKIESLHDDFDRLLRAPRERGEFGEVQLEVMLSDHLHPGMYGIREQVVGSKTPDAHVETPEGIVAIDSKFPLDRYEQFLQADDPEQKRAHKRAFRDAVESQLAKIERDYVDPSAGTTDFAFAYIPSESVYYHLITEEYDLLREYTKRGVQVVSPLTLGHKLELLKTGAQAQKLSEEAEAVLDHLAQLGDRFESVEDEWSTHKRHVDNAAKRADDVDRALGQVRDAFDRIDRPEGNLSVTED
ncbi:DNA recombination protein RmuC [Halodesulfurarchaeum formicicum]|uniref:DNA recombination protein RmuC n=1 Tax=Halodesulfurarchaeum formicicum TaxID=1873524 RepID=A0A1J1AE20_9EURY|nr:DNA recombination protein RmuC [Halodesulfurarchaeum formicicum]APE96027.1 DNA recombination protein RmuC [Halodesulfurarchaeum formicicum]